MLSINADKYGLCVVDFLSIITDCEYEIMKDLDQYDLRENIKYSNQNVKTVFYFYIIKRVCDVIINIKHGNRIVFFFNDECINRYDFSFCEFSSLKSFTDFVKSVVNKLNAILPILIYKTCDICYDDILDNYTTGDIQDIMLTMSNMRQNKSNSFFTFERAKKFIKQYKLTYLDKEYFNEVKVKALMYK